MFNKMLKLYIVLESTLNVQDVSLEGYEYYTVPDDYTNSPLLARGIRRERKEKVTGYKKGESEGEGEDIIVVQTSEYYPAELLLIDSGIDFVDLVHTADFYQMWNVASFMQMLMSSTLVHNTIPFVKFLLQDVDVSDNIPRKVIDRAYEIEADNFWSKCDYNRGTMMSLIRELDIPEQDLLVNFTLGYLHPILFDGDPEQSWSLVKSKSDIQKLLYLHMELKIRANTSIIEIATLYSSIDCYPYINDRLSFGHKNSLVHDNSFVNDNLQVNDNSQLSEIHNITEQHAFNIVNNDNIFKHLLKTNITVGGSGMVNLFFHQLFKRSEFFTDQVQQITGIYKNKTVTTNDIVSADVYYYDKKSKYISFFDSNFDLLRVDFNVNFSDDGKLYFDCSCDMLVMITTSVRPLFNVSTIGISLYKSSCNIGFDPDIIPDLFVNSTYPHLRHYIHTDDDNYERLWNESQNRQELVELIYDKLFPTFELTDRNLTPFDMNNMLFISASNIMYFNVKRFDDHDDECVFYITDKEHDTTSIGDKLRNYKFVLAHKINKTYDVQVEDIFSGYTSLKTRTHSIFIENAYAVYQHDGDLNDRDFGDIISLYNMRKLV
jgi:hypothetical protein